MTISCAADAATKADYLHVEDPNYVEPEVTFTTASTFPEPNRFDPFEALDRVIDFVQAGYDGVLDAEMLRNAQGYIHALRAYITGMEK